MIRAGRVAWLGLGLMLAMSQPLPAATNDSTDQVAQKRLFPEPLAWVGDQRPPEVESGELLGDIGRFESSGVGAGLDGLEQFLAAHPQSAWAPSLAVNLAEYYRLHGRYSLALAHWQAAWNATKAGPDAGTQKLAVRAIAGWTRLLASLGEKEKLNALFQELADRQLPLGVYGTTINETKEGLAMMNARPGVSYRCGSFALGHLAQALGQDRKTCLKLFETDSPEGGFHLSQLLELAQSNGLAMAAVRRPAGADLVVPCVVHWKLNHYAAITEKKGDLYRVEDPTFEGHVWMDAATIEAEAGGEFILPQDQVPAGWTKLSAAECATIYGKGFPRFINNQNDYGPNGCGGDGGGGDDSEDSGCDPPAANDGAVGGGSGNPPNPPPCPDCGMPQWSVSEPYITLWLKDTPLLYHQSSGRAMRLTLSYKSRGDAQSSAAGGFGDKWSCNWLGMLQGMTNSDTVTDVRAGGGQETFQTNGALAYSSGRSFGMVSCAAGDPCDGDPPAIVLPDGAYNFYGEAVGDGFGDTNYFLCRRNDQYGRLLQRFNYQTIGNLTRMTNTLDLDGHTNTLSYGNPTFTNLITAVTDPYGHTAYFNYNSLGLLTNIVDAQGLSTVFQYDSSENITNMITLYGTNSFQYYDGTNYDGTIRLSLAVTEASGDQQLYAYCAVGPEGDGDSYHWNRAQYAAISTGDKTNLLDLPSADYALAGIKNWMTDWPGGLETSTDTMAGSAPAGVSRNWTYYYYQGGGPGNVGALKQVTGITLPSGWALDIARNSLGRPTNYLYHNYDAYNDSGVAYTNVFDASGTILRYELGPRGELTRGYGYDPVTTNLLVAVTNAMGDVLRYTHDSGLRVTSIAFPGGLVRTNFYYASGPYQGFLAQQIDLGFRTNAFGYLNGNLSAQTNELGLVTTYLYDNLSRLVATAYPDGTTVSNVYNALDIVATKDRLNQWTYYGYNPVRQLMAVTNVNGQITSYDYCGCGAPALIIRWNGSTPVTTQLSYDIAGNLTNASYADYYQLSYTYDTDDRVQTITDGGGNQVQYFYEQHGLASQVQYAFLGGQQILAQLFDEYGRVTNSVDRNNVATALNYDFLDRLATRQLFGGDGTPAGQESFSYNALGLTNYVDQLGHPTFFVRDLAGRVLAQTNANLEVQQFAYNPADELLALTDGKNQVTAWGYDAFGRVTNKVDALGTNVFRYQYDADNRLTNRWSAAKGSTVYVYDALGNLTQVVYAHATNSYYYDALNRLTNLVDGVGATAFAWTAGDQLAGETGPWANDAVNYSYNGARQRSGLSVQAPNASPWVQGYGYDGMMQLTGVTSPAGSFGYTYSDTDIGESDRVYKLKWGNNTVYNDYDGLLRLTSTTLQVPSLASEFQYGYDAGSEVTQQVFTAGNYINYGYDAIGQLKTAQGLESDGVTLRLQEQFGYGYDGAWNLNQRTNNALVQSFNVNSLNELTTATNTGRLTVAGTATEPKGGYSSWGSPAGVTNVTVNTSNAAVYLDGSFAATNFAVANGNNSFTAIAQDTYGRWSTNVSICYLPATNSYVYDLNGNLLGDGTRSFAYDDENELTGVWVANTWSNNFAYDGLLRRRIEKDFSYNGSAWVKTNEVRYIYDVNLVVQERDQNNLPLVTYTRGNDLSGGLQGAGGIGGLLARTDMGKYITGDWQASAYYYFDGNGNVAGLIYTNGLFAAQYNYDPFGNILTMSGPLAPVNKYRFSTKEWNDNAGLYYYGFRFYDPLLQRWPNRDPIQEWGGYNLYDYVGNDPINLIDPDGNCPAFLAIPLASAEALATASAAAAAAVATAAVGVAGGAGYGLGTLADRYTPIGAIGPAIGNWWTPQVGRRDTGVGTSTGDTKADEKVRGDRKSSESGKNKKAPQPPQPQPPDPNDLNDQPWWKKPNTPVPKGNTDPNVQPPAPPKDFCPAPSGGS